MKKFKFLISFLTNKTQFYFSFFKCKKLLLIPCFIAIFLLLFAFFSSSVVHAKSKKLSILVPDKKIYLQDKVSLRVKKKPKNSVVSFFCNKPSIAKITKKSGKITPKKLGTIVITAKAVKKHKTVAKQKFSFTITKKQTSSPTLPNVTFTANSNIDPFSLSVTLHSSRILLQQEVTNSTIMLSSAQNKAKYIMKFSAISEDGKNLTFQANPSDAKMMCPGNGTSDGIYYITSTLFSNKLKTNYKERFSNSSLRGFVLDDNGEFLSDANLSLIDASTHDVISKTSTNQFGYYEFSINSNKTYSLYVTKLNYSPRQMNHITNSSNAIALPIILKSLDSPTSIGILLSTDSGNPIAGHEIKIYDKNDTFLFSGTTNKEGAVNFSSSPEKQALYTKLISTNPDEPKFISENYPANLQNNDITNLYIPTNEKLKIVIDDYNLYQGQQISFSFHSCINNQIVICAQLEPYTPLSTDNIILSWKDSQEYNACSSLQISLFSQSGNSIFEYSCAAPKNTSMKMSLLSTSFPVFLSNSPIYTNDGNYYLSIKGFDINKRLLSVPIIEQISIKNHKLPSSTFIFQKSNLAKVLLYSDTSTSFPDNIDLYEKIENLFFYITSISITPSSDKPSQVASCSINHLRENSQYYISTRCGSITNPYFYTNKDKVVSELTDTTLPSFQFIFSPHNSDTLNTDNNLFLSDSSNQTLASGITDISSNYKIIDVEEDDFFSSSTYPNTVYIFYTKSGTLNYCLFTTSSFSSLDRKWPSGNSAYIYDKLTYKKAPLTSQSHYSDTSFFVI